MAVSPNPESQNLLDFRRLFRLRPFDFRSNLRYNGDNDYHKMQCGPNTWNVNCQWIQRQQRDWERTAQEIYRLRLRRCK